MCNLTATSSTNFATEIAISSAINSYSRHITTKTSVKMKMSVNQADSKWTDNSKCTFTRTYSNLTEDLVKAWIALQCGDCFGYSVAQQAPQRSDRPYQIHICKCVCACGNSKTSKFHSCLWTKSQL